MIVVGVVARVVVAAGAALVAEVYAQLAAHDLVVVEVAHC